MWASGFWVKKAWNFPFTQQCVAKAGYDQVQLERSGPHQTLWSRKNTWMVHWKRTTNFACETMPRPLSNGCLRCGTSCWKAIRATIRTWVQQTFLRLLVTWMWGTVITSQSHLSHPTLRQLGGPVYRRFIIGLIFFTLDCISRQQSNDPPWSAGLGPAQPFTHGRQHFVAKCNRGLQVLARAITAFLKQHFGILVWGQLSRAALN